ncbi:MAG: gliding motility-associated C-terminal domain-containing protein [Muribaculaceae bacterium]|nr:gliding motility-associated C-terminal domain-containing protein [Muribaculaceae bacterium]
MKLRNILTMIAVALALVANAQIQFTGNDHALYEEEPAASTGLNKIYVLYDTDGVGMTYTADTENPVTWYIYGELGGGYAEEMTGVQHDGLTTSISQVVPNKGYIIEEGTSRLYVWVVNYADYRLHLNSVTVDNDNDCSTATLHVDGSGPDVAYFTITGVRKVMDRGITLSYNNLVWDGGTQGGDDDDEDEEEIVSVEAHWAETLIEENEETFKPTIVVPAPTENTQFTVSGDKFLRFWNEEESVESNYYTTAAIDVRAFAIQEDRHHDNEKKTGGEGALGGSAPAHITFKAYCTDAVMHKEWQMCRENDFNNIELRINQEETDQTFEDAGITYWRFYAANGDGSCEWYSDVFAVNIGESELYCPNVFTPGTSEGVNDVWKVSYRSIVKFQCTIFNRWGNKIIDLNDPSQGWDGTYKGKLVPAGVYFYVLQAEGSDGKKYKKSGDINIIRYKRIDHSAGGDGTVVHE